MGNEPTIAYSVTPVNRSWTATKIVAIVVAIVSGLYMLPWVIALFMALRSQDRVVIVVTDTSS